MGDHIYTIKPDGSDRQLVLRWACDDLHWSPDGTRLLFYSNRGQGGTNGEIYAANLDGTGRTALSRHPAADNHPRWRPE